MDKKRIKDLILPVSEYVTINENSTLFDMIAVLNKAKKKTGGPANKHSTVLIVDDEGHVIGEIDYLDFLQSLEPKYKEIRDPENFLHAGVSPDYMESTADTLRLWEDNVERINARAKSIKITDVMRPTREHIDENASLLEAAHRFVMYHTLVLFVKRNNKITGLLRISDVYAEITRFMLNADS
ncbi:CBS domain-containing protein [candidate division KSB1 bacterium]